MPGEVSKNIGSFGVGVPEIFFGLMGFPTEDLTFVPPATGQGKGGVAGVIEPFMDPFVRAFLLNLEAGIFDTYPCIVFLREATGAIHAYQYANELRRLGMLPTSGPRLVICNLLVAQSACADAFNAKEVARVRAELAPLMPVAGARADNDQVRQRAELTGRLAHLQMAAGISGAVGFELRRMLRAQASADTLSVVGAAIEGAVAPTATTRRFAILGAPLGNPFLIEMLESEGQVVADPALLTDHWQTQAPLDEASQLAAFTSNPFHPRQTKTGAMLAELQRIWRADPVTDVIWQVDPHDDLFGWMMPDIRALCDGLGIGFVDLGFVARWPAQAEIASVRARLVEHKVIAQ